MDPDREVDEADPLTASVAPQRVMLVTGASRGIGARVAVLAAGQGYAVAINYLRDDDAAQSVAADIATAGGKAALVRADVSDQHQVRDMFAAVDASLGTLDVLVNNAGILEVLGIDDVSEEALLRSYRANVFGPAYCAREAVRRMSSERGGKGGAIVNVSSVAARLGGLGIAYAGSKGAMDSFTFALAKELATQGIRVNAVRPGLIETEIHEASGGIEKIRHLARTAVPVGRSGHADEVAQAIVWLASDAASYVHGTLLDVAGGR